MIADFCTYLGHWPPYPLEYSDASGLLHLMDRAGINLAFVSGLDGLFAFDCSVTNRTLAAQVAGHEARLRPIGTLNPSRPTWRADLAEGREQLGLAGFRLHPAYHGYALDAPEAIELAQALGVLDLPLFVAAYVDEERFQSPALRVPPVPAAQILGLLQAAPATTVVVNNLSPEEAAWLEEQGSPLANAWFDVSAMDKPGDGLVSLVQQVGASQLVFGSQAPFLYPEASLTLVLASGLGPDDAQAVLWDNWQRSPVLRNAAGNFSALGARQ